MATGRPTRSSTTLRRKRPRNAGKRAPFPGWLPKESKLEQSRAAPPSVPAHIRALGVELDPERRAYIRRKLGMKLGKFAASIERISVRVEDVNGPRGGVDHACRIKVVLSDLPSVVIEERDASLAAAIDVALGGVERAVRRAVQRRRVKSTRRGKKTSEPLARA